MIITSVLWPPHAQSWLIEKDSDAGRDWGQEEKGMTEDEMAGCHHWLDGCEFEWTPGVGDGQGGLACCDSWGCKELDMTERLNWTELIIYSLKYSTFLAIENVVQGPIFTVTGEVIRNVTDLSQFSPSQATWWFPIPGRSLYWYWT